MRRLYLQIYLTIIAILVIVFVAVGTLWRMAAASRFDHAVEAASEFVDNDLPPAGAPHRTLQQAVDGLRREIAADVSLFSPDGMLLAAAGRPIPPARLDRPAPGWLPGPGGPSWLVRLNDGRALVI